MKLENDEAIRILDRIRDEDSYTEKVYEALSMAINALKGAESGTRRKYEDEGSETSWITDNATAECRKCGHIFPFFVSLERYCPHCGRRNQMIR